MNPTLRNVLAVIAGWLAGSFINGIIISTYPSVFPLPVQIIEGDIQSLIDNAHLLELEHLISVFLAHALGALIGGFLAAKIGTSRHLMLSMIVGGLFLIGGIAINAVMHFTPVSFAITDILLAYIPMAWIGWKMAHPLSHTKVPSHTDLLDEKLN